MEATLSFQRKAILIGAVLALIFICTNCGGSNSTNPVPLSIRLSPAAPVVAVNSSIFIGAKTTPILPEYYSTMTWSIQGYQSQTDCTEIVANAQEAPAMPDCPNGWLAWETPLPGYTVTGVYYYGPGVAGSYQVQAQGVIADQPTSQNFQGNASAIVTVEQ